LKKLFIKNPEDRLTIDQMKTHPWITEDGKDPMPEDFNNRVYEKPTAKDMNNLMTSMKEKIRCIIRKKSDNRPETKSALC